MIDIPQSKFHMLINSDVMSGLKRLPDESVDLCVTSPPYWGLRDYGVESIVWGTKEECEHQWGELQPPLRKRWGNPDTLSDKQSSNRGSFQMVKALESPTGQFCIKCNAWIGQLGLEPTFQLYVQHIVDVFHEVRRVIKPAGSLYLNLGDTYSGSKVGNDDPKNSKLEDVDRHSWKKEMGSLPSKCLSGIPERIMEGLINDDRDDIYELKKDLYIKRVSPFWDSPFDKDKKTNHKGLLPKAQGEDKQIQSSEIQRMEKKESGESKTNETEILQETSFGNSSPQKRSMEENESNSENGNLNSLWWKSSEVCLLWGDEDSILDSRPYQWWGEQAKKAISISDYIPLAEKERMARRIQNSVYELQSRIRSLPYLSTSNGKWKIRREHIPADLIDCFKLIKQDRWILRNKIVWHKPNHMPSSVRDRLTSSYEIVYFFVKQKNYWFDLDAIREPLETHEKRPAGIVRAREYGYDSKFAGFMGIPAKVQIKGDKDVERGYSYSREARKNAHGDKSHVPLPPRDAHNINGKNPGDVWTINTKPFSGAHFAVFPPKLIEKPVKASCPSEVCSKCNVLRERIIETDNPSKYMLDKNDPMAIATHTQHTSNAQTSKSLHRNEGGVYYSGKTVGWTKCSCEAPFYPGIVLDPFAGSGTVALVAKENDRSSISIEVKKEYCEIFKKRVDFGQSTMDDVMWISL